MGILMSESYSTEQKIIKNLESIYDDSENEIFTYPDISFPKFDDDFQLSNLNK